MKLVKSIKIIESVGFLCFILFSDDRRNSTMRDDGFSNMRKAERTTIRSVIYLSLI